MFFQYLRELTVRYYQGPVKCQERMRKLTFPHFKVFVYQENDFATGTILTLKTDSAKYMEFSVTGKFSPPAILKFLAPTFSISPLLPLFCTDLHLFSVFCKICGFLKVVFFCNVLKVAMR